MKCPTIDCKGDLKLTSFKRKTWSYATQKDYGILKCNICEHKEEFK